MNNWHKNLRENATVLNDTHNHLKHVRIVDNNTKEIKYERWVVKYENKILKTLLVFDNKEDAIEYRDECEKLMTKERLSKYKKEETIGYPSNLLKTIGIELYDDNEVLNNFEENFSKVAEKLDDIEVKILKRRFEEYKTLEKIGNEFGFTRERARQIEAKALRKLEVRRNIFLNKNYNEEKDITYEEALNTIKKYYNESLSDRIVDLPLSVRAINALRREGFETYNDIKNLNEDDLIKIREIGRKTVREIADFIEERNRYIK